MFHITVKRQRSFWQVTSEYVIPANSLLFRSFLCLIRHQKATNLLVDKPSFNKAQCKALPSPPHYVSQGERERSALFHLGRVQLQDMWSDRLQSLLLHTGWEKVTDVFIFSLKGQWTLAASLPTPIILQPKRILIDRRIVRIFMSTKDQIQWPGQDHYVSLLRKTKPNPLWTLNTAVKACPNSVTL